MNDKKWWKFAPWQPMKTIQKMKPLIIMANGVIQHGVFYVDNEGNVFEIWSNEHIGNIKDCEAWLPLPEETQ